VTSTTTATSPPNGTREPPAGDGATTEFERLYRTNVDAVTAYFARRTADPQVVADLTADTFVAVITYFGVLRSA
jgi:RNA polymerase sigma-70 factor (ECF subfamily)